MVLRLVVVLVIGAIEDRGSCWVRKLFEYVGRGTKCGGWEESSRIYQNRSAMGGSIRYLMLVCVGADEQGPMTLVWVSHRVDEKSS